MVNGKVIIDCIFQDVSKIDDPVVHIVNNGSTIDASNSGDLISLFWSILILLSPIRDV